MIARIPRPWALWCMLGLGCADDGAGEDEGTTEPPPVREDPKSGDPCDVDGVEGERRCALEGDLLYTCEGSLWSVDSCGRHCGSLAGTRCTLGCLITQEGEDCLCVPCG